VLAPQRPWLCQGDVFELLPWVLTRLVDGEVKPYGDSGGALLVSDGCQIDKRDNSGPLPITRIERLQFAPLRAVDDLRNQDHRQRVRNLNPNPPEPVYVGEVPGFEGDYFAALSEVYDLPAAYFDPELKDRTGDLQLEPDDPDPWRLMIRDHDTRVGSLADDLLKSMRRKMILYWTGKDPRNTA
jgi:hypothetical protein